jgi:hypothetical protein
MLKVVFRGVARSGLTEGKGSKYQPSAIAVRRFVISIYNPPIAIIDKRYR